MKERRISERVFPVAALAVPGVTIPYLIASGIGIDPNPVGQAMCIAVLVEMADATFGGILVRDFRRIFYPRD